MIRKINIYKILIFSILITVSVNNVYSQTVRYDHGYLVITNSTGNYQKFVLGSNNYNSNSILIAPNKSDKLYVGTKKKDIRLNKLYMIYDGDCYNKDLEIVNKPLEELRKQRLKSQLLIACLRALDQYFTEGKISAFVDEINILSGYVKGGKSINELIQDFVTMKVQDEIIASIDDKMARSLASASFVFLRLAEEEKFPEIDKMINNNMNKLRNSKRVDIDYANNIHSYNNYEMRVEGSFPVSQSYKAFNEKAVFGKYQTTQIPYNLRLVNTWRNIAHGFFISLDYCQSPLIEGFINQEGINGVYDNPFSYNTIDIGAGMNSYFGNRNSYWFFELGARNFFRNEYMLPSATGVSSMRDYQKIQTFEYQKTMFYVNAGLSFNLKICNLFAYYSFSGKKDSAIWTSQVQAGISIPLFGKYTLY